MDSSSPYIRFATYSKFKKVVTSYKDDELDTTDRRILRGLFRKNLKDFDEKQEPSWKKSEFKSRINGGQVVKSGNVSTNDPDFIK